MINPPQRISFVTLGVSDLTASKKFYTEKFGWHPLENDSEGIVFFQMNGLILSLFPDSELAADAGIINNGAGFKRFTLAINCYSEQEVNDIFSSLKEKGVEIVKPPEKAFWGGYSGYVKDNDNNLWEFAYNPFIALDNSGNITSPGG
ncbi:VOC family protein [Flavihumibacter profundi]|uniref:VOC family protein n=1 Tax=Flavihumibacter profundi TaxID=2716883 RepID=UPI001CC3D92C|nr:VOC family protein [Flavihumibacter profundi]MBZ5858467.1 VOC family protein [Flavihumibacter profundi]